MAFYNRCVNCTITLRNPRIVSRGVLELDTPLRDLLISWISPIEVTSEYRVCEECFVILQTQAQMDEPCRNYGHRSVCLGCGVSVLRARSIPMGSNRHECTVIQAWVPQIQADLQIFTRVCRPCWRRATRAQATSTASSQQELYKSIGLKPPQGNAVKECDPKCTDSTKDNQDGAFNEKVSDKKIEDSNPKAELLADSSKHSEDIADGLVSEPLKPKATYRNPRLKIKDEDAEVIEEYLSDFESEPECQPETESQEDAATDDTSDQLLLCRGCFATDVKMFDLDSMDLKQTFEEFVGKTKVEELPHYLCSYCATSLVRFSQYRERCRRAEVLLQHLSDNNMLNPTLIKSIDRPYYKVNLNLSISKLVHMETDEIEIKSEDDDEEDDVKSDREESGMYANIVTNDKTLQTDEGISETNPSVKYLQKDDVANMDIDRSIVYLQENEEGISNIGQQDVEAEIDNIGQYVDCIEENDPDISDTKQSEDDMDTKVIKEFLNRINKIKVPSKKKSIVDTYEKEFSMEVKILTKEEQLQFVQARKSSSNYLNSKFRCDHCFKGFMSSEKFRNHFNCFHHPAIGELECSMCRARFDNRKKLHYHMVNHKYLFKCKICGFKTTRRFGAKNHHYKHAGRNYTCEYCGKSFKYSTTYLSHLRLIHRTGLNVWCRLCGDSFLSDLGLKAHRRLMHMNIEYQCLQCGLSFLNESALLVHNNGQCVDNCCAQCGESCPDEESLKVHFTDKHGKAKCALCNVEFKSRVALESHLENSSAKCRNVKCCVWCGECYLTSDLLNEHIAFQHNKYKVSCSVCNKGFPTKKSYNDHYKQTHWESKPRGRRDFMTWPRQWGLVEGEEGTYISTYNSQTSDQQEGKGGIVCELCGKTYPNKLLLKLHLHRHSGVKPFACSVCDKRFSNSMSLTVHSRVHTGEKPYSCEYCPKRFARKSAINRHTLIHTGERRHICQICNKDFVTSTDVKTHIKTVHLKIITPRVRRSRSNKRGDCEG
ncbi:unnamed protein product [Chilo suppressalis]|uniref:C2H2-type domain-containing protein n=1 Tax=Chilo suppressalis TaxID=168631 RepID=A0ABN8B651_CHISP|nr:unnamed protein product [Chilo suppressalis]